MNQLIPTEKTILDWCADNGITGLYVDVKPEDKADILGVGAIIILDKQTGRGDFSFNVWNEDGEPSSLMDYDGMTKEDGITIAKFVTKLTEILRKPYPTNY